MFKRLLSLVLAALLIQLAFDAQVASASTDAQKQARLTEKVRMGILKLGTGTDVRVAVKLRDKTRLAGYISEVREDSFFITDTSSGVATAVAYHSVTQLKGHNLSTGAKVAIVALSIAVALLAFFLWLENYD